jgi:hypothetical protein
VKGGKQYQEKQLSADSADSADSEKRECTDLTDAAKREHRPGLINFRLLNLRNADKKK